MIPVMMAKRKRNRLAVEIGTHRGEFAKRLVKPWNRTDKDGFKHLICVDPYTNGYDNGDPASHGNRGKDYQAALKVASNFLGRITILKVTSEEASKQIDDHPDCVYIDGVHRYVNVKQDLELWWPKIRSGGIIAGHDFICSGARSNLGWGGEVQPAVFEFSIKHDLIVWLVVETTNQNWSYYMIKP